MLRYLDEYRDADVCKKIAEKIRCISTKPFNIMEVCGGHTMAIRKNGIHSLVGENINLISGPGCPVCVTSIRDIDRVLKLAEAKDVVICSFGDMMNVPGSDTSLSEARALGAEVKTVYSVNDVLAFAKKDPGKRFIFISIGFETTAPLTAAAIIRAREEKILNFNVLALNKTMPKAIKAVLGAEDCNIDALLGPGHVSTITGINMYKPVVYDMGISCCISGFEPMDLLRSIFVLTDLFEKDRIEIVNAYERVVCDEGNLKALKIMETVFEPVTSEWRGLGDIEGSGLKIRNEYSDFDAENFFDIEVPETKEISGCICGEILRGTKTPENCSLFGSICTPLSPKGACMVSSEGTCAAWYKYAR